MSNLWPVGCMKPRMAMNVAQYKIVNLLKTFFFCSSVFVSVCVFNVWPKTTLLLPVWPRDTKRLDTSRWSRSPNSFRQSTFACPHTASFFHFVSTLSFTHLCPFLGSSSSTNPFYLQFPLGPSSHQHLSQYKASGIFLLTQLFDLG